jgi:hypothetical protein
MELAVRVEDPELEKLLWYPDPYERVEQTHLLQRARGWIQLTDPLNYPFSQEEGDVCSPCLRTEGIHAARPRRQPVRALADSCVRAKTES